MKNLSSIKNMGWALAIILCLLVLFVALIVAAVLPYSGPIERGSVQLNALSDEQEALPQEKQEEILGELRTLPGSGDAGQGYIDGLTFLCDSTTIGLRDYGLLPGGTLLRRLSSGQPPSPSPRALYLVARRAPGATTANRGS